MSSSFAIGWRQVAACFALLASISMVASSYSIVAAPLEREFEVSRKVLMLAMTVSSLGSALLSPVIGNLMDRTSLRRLMLLGTVTLVAGYFALSHATAFWQVLVIFGLLMAPANVLMGILAATVLLSRWFSERRGTAIGIAIAGVGFGGMVYPPLIQWLLDNHDWREALRLLALILGAVTVPAALLVVSSPGERGLNADGADSAAEARRVAGEAAPISARAILSDPAFWMVATVLVVVSAGMKGMVTNLSLLAGDQGIRPSDAALLITLFSGGGLVSKGIFAALADRISPRYLLIASLIGFAIGMALITQAHGSYGVMAAGVTMTGLSGGLMVPAHAFLMPRIFGPQVVGRAMGLNSTASLVVLLMVPPLFGLIFDITGSYSGILYAFAGLALLVCLMVPYIRMHPRGLADSA